MEGTYARDWKPGNHCGSTHYDPREELACRVRQARDRHDAYVAIPLALGAVVAELRECTATTVITSDEDGPLSSPQTLHCRRPEGAHHGENHGNGYMSWKREPA